KRRQKLCLISLIKQKRVARLIKGKLGENRHKPLSGTNIIPHTPHIKGLINITHRCHRHHFSPTGVIALPNLRASDSDFSEDKSRPSPHRRGCVKHKNPQPNSATRAKDSTTPTLNDSSKGELCNVGIAEDHRTDHLLPVIVATGAPPPQLRLHCNKTT
uniref:Uncharacterized protein n=1 Tax=Triticum urartu TaxID=4572 RepID=A0A8R7PJ79_TRIUA